jgi:hypothetical protein
VRSVVLLLVLVLVLSAPAAHADRPSDGVRVFPMRIQRGWTSSLGRSTVVPRPSGPLKPGKSHRAKLDVFDAAGNTAVPPPRFDAPVATQENP